MENFNFYSPTYFAFGKDREKDCGDLVKKFGGNKVLIHYGGGSALRSGLIDRVKDSLNKAGIAFIELGGVMPNPRSGLVYEGIDLCRKEKVDFVLAVGGGSVIDSAKAIAAGSIYEGDFWDFYQGKFIEKALPIGTILAIAAAGSEGSGDSVITNENGMIKRGATGDGMPKNFEELGAKEEDIEKLAHTCCHGNGNKSGKIGGFVSLEQKDVKQYTDSCFDLRRPA